jgi:hypothetical protein
MIRGLVGRYSGSQGSLAGARRAHDRSQVETRERRRKRFQAPTRTASGQLSTGTNREELARNRRTPPTIDLPRMIGSSSGATHALRGAWACTLTREDPPVRLAHAALTIGHRSKTRERPRKCFTAPTCTASGQLNIDTNREELARNSRTLPITDLPRNDPRSRRALLRLSGEPAPAHTEETILSSCWRMPPSRSVRGRNPLSRPKSFTGYRRRAPRAPN